MSAAHPHPPGTPVLEDYRKWDGQRHWQVRGILLGDDQWGTWVGFPADTRMRRPGRDFRIQHARVAMYPQSQGWAASFWRSGEVPASAHVYIDLATAPAWSGEAGLVVTLIDLDLDVVRTFDGRTYIDDEDEFVEHTAAYRYPPELVAQVRSDADRLLEQVRAGQAPFDADTHKRWARELTQRTQVAQ